MAAVTFRDATSWLRTYAERCLWRTVAVGPVMANFLLIYCDNNNNNKHDNVYGAVIMAEPLREFTRFI